jgi:hypothetical protein
MSMKICSVASCNSRSIAKGFCDNHYRRWKKYGDPLAGGTAPGAAQKFFREVVLTYDGDECLIWPFASTSAGYAQVTHNGKLKIASRAVCEEVYGPAPSPTHQAAHSCGKGDCGCVTKRHLSWKTPEANCADKVEHGTILRGETHPNARLTRLDIATIRSQRGKVRQADIAERFGISRSYVSEIQSGHAWATFSTINAG